MDELAQLQEKLRFSDADLEANRAGRLSDAQKRKMMREAKEWKAWLIGGVLLMGGVTIAGILVTRSWLKGDNGVVWGILAIVAVLLAFVVGISLWPTDQQTRTEINIGAVNKAEGTATLAEDSSKASLTYIVTIGRHEIRGVPEATYRAFKAGRQYRVYYLRNRIFAAESLN